MVSARLARGLAPKDPAFAGTLPTGVDKLVEGVLTMLWGLGNPTLKQHEGSQKDNP